MKVGGRHGEVHSRSHHQHLQPSLAILRGETACWWPSRLVRPDVAGRLSRFVPPTSLPAAFFRCSALQDSVRIMAKDLVRTRKQKQKMMMMHTQIQAVSLKIQSLKSVDTMANAMKGVTKVRLRSDLDVMARSKLPIS